MIRKKEKSKLNVLLEYYKLPNYVKGPGGEMIFGKLEIKSRKEFVDLKSSLSDTLTAMAFKAS